MKCRAWSLIAALASGFLLCLSSASGQRQNAPPANVAGIPVNYDESLVGGYTLPDPLVLSGGRRVRDAQTWYGKRRPEIVRLFEEQQFGRSPGRPILRTLGYYMHAGGHGTIPSDWEQYLKFMRLHLRP